MDVNRHHLAVFHAVAATGRVADAGARLGISQPAVSKQLAALERSLDARLFDRTRGGMRPTPTGELVFGYTERIEALHARLLDDLDALRDRRLGKLALGASTTIGLSLVPGLLSAFRSAHEDLATEVRIGNTAEIESGVVDGSLELGLLEGPTQHPELRAEVFARDRLLAVAPAGHAWSARKTVGPEAFLREPFLARELGSGTRAVVDAAFAAAGHPLQPRMTLSGTATVKAFVAAGHGVSVLSEHTVSDEVAAGRLVALPVRGLALERPWWLVRASGRTLSPAARAAVDLIKGRGRVSRR